LRPPSSNEPSLNSAHAPLFFHNDFARNSRGGSAQGIAKRFLNTKDPRPVYDAGTGALTSSLSFLTCSIPSPLCCEQYIRFRAGVPNAAWTKHSGCKQTGLITFTIPLFLCAAQKSLAPDAGGPKDARVSQSPDTHFRYLESGIPLQGL